MTLLLKFLWFFAILNVSPLCGCYLQLKHNLDVLYYEMSSVRLQGLLISDVFVDLLAYQWNVHGYFCISVWCDANFLSIQYVIRIS